MIISTFVNVEPDRVVQGKSASPRPARTGRPRSAPRLCVRCNHGASFHGYGAHKCQAMGCRHCPAMVWPEKSPIDSTEEHKEHKEQSTPSTERLLTMSLTDDRGGVLTMSMADENAIPKGTNGRTVTVSTTNVIVAVTNPTASVVEITISSASDDGPGRSA